MILRKTLISLFLTIFAATSLMAAEKATLGPDGLHVQKWFHPTSLNLLTDLQTAKDAGKGLLILWEQEGCVYCAQLHAVNFTRDDVVSMLTDNFLVVQLDLRGTRDITGFDGNVISESALAAKWLVSFTPTTMVFGGAPATVTARADTEIFRLPGYLKPFYHYSALDYFSSGAFKGQDFPDFLAVRVAEIETKGLTPDTW
ncbi:MAG: thioredoxin fold domain-containing protein [Rhodobacterales bacterium]|nr:thioredoxin fold domain-containing protein [Rhodobacterales bacterium]